MFYNQLIWTNTSPFDMDMTDLLSQILKPTILFMYDFCYDW